MPVANEDRCKCLLLPDGRNIELRSRTRSGGALTPDENQRLTMVGCMADSFARYGTPALFDQKVSTKEIEFWLDHVMSELEILSEDARWIRRGILF